MAGLYEHSILFEIINKNNPSQMVEAFTLPVPPKSIDVVQSQRVTRTKTFGGIFEDDYGIDIAKIAITGTTGNEESRATFIPNQGSGQTYTGKEAIFALRDKIIRYKKNLQAQYLDQYELRMYDLSSLESSLWQAAIAGSATQTGIIHANSDAWVVSLDDFKISRSDDKPLWYNYSIELTAIVPLGEYQINHLPRTTSNTLASYPDPDSVSNVAAEVGTSESTLSLTAQAVAQLGAVSNRVMGALQRGYTWATSTVQKINQAFNDLDSYTSQITDYVNSMGSVVVEGIGLYRRLFEVAKFPAAAAKALLKSVNSAMIAIEHDIEFTAGLSEILGNDYDNIPLLCQETRRIVAQIVAFGKSSASDAQVTISVRGINYTMFGTIAYTANQNTTMARLSEMFYGDPTKEELLVTFNGMSDDDIAVGTIVKIPLLTNVTRQNNNRIFSWDRTSNFGTDSDGSDLEIVVDDSGDFATISEEANLIQAVNMRLNETLGKRLLLTTYGITMGSGGAANGASPVSYIIANIQNTLKQDPRIQDITDLAMRGAGDKLELAFNIETISGTVKYQGVI